MVKSLIEFGGVDPSHTDPWGVTAIQKAKIHEQMDVYQYLEEINKDEEKLKKLVK